MKGRKQVLLMTLTIGALVMLFALPGIGSFPSVRLLAHTAYRIMFGYAQSESGQMSYLDCLQRTIDSWPLGLIAEYRGSSNAYREQRFIEIAVPRVWLVPPGTKGSNSEVIFDSSVTSDSTSPGTTSMCADSEIILIRHD